MHERANVEPRRQACAPPPRAGISICQICPADHRLPRTSVNSIIECGRLLIAAKDELKHGEFLKMIENNLPFKRSTAQALMKIAKDGRITKNQRGCLPAHWSTLIKLIQLPDAAFEARIADGTIHPGLERRPAVEMIEFLFFLAA